MCAPPFPFHFRRIRTNIPVCEESDHVLSDGRLPESRDIASHALRVTSNDSVSVLRRSLTRSRFQYRNGEINDGDDEKEKKRQMCMHDGYISYRREQVGGRMAMDAHEREKKKQREDEAGPTRGLSSASIYPFNPM